VAADIKTSSVGNAEGDLMKMEARWQDMYWRIVDIYIDAESKARAYEKELAHDMEIHNPGYKHPFDTAYDEHKAYINRLDRRRPAKYKLQQKRLDAGRSWPNPPKGKRETW
jgi:hypothetical protein